ncbi:Rne/Rng family ribonuclease [Arenimonas sp.]|jgi:ribonuclease E|uniref:Rne/Rng family ribonuclease n=1 Tax=Arenimonas sp. TaxID=1872635 RepID=UPI0037C13A84
MKRMLINATQAEELRVAIVDGQQLYDIDIEQPAKEQKKSNIYKGRIVRLEPSLEAAFVDYGGPRHGFLPLKEISRDYFVPGVDPNKAGMKEYLREGQEVVVQVDKEERGNKGAALTTYISLAGRYMVLMPNSPTAGGVSRRIEGDDRQALKQTMDALNIPDDMGVIIRTAGMGRDADELQWDLDYLIQVWKAISQAALSKPSPFLIYQESRLIIRALRDYMRPEIGEVLVDTDEIFEQAQDFMQLVMPHNLRKLKMYKDDIPLFNRFQIESQIEQAYERTVRLPSGGSIVLDQTEALTAVDVNSSRATKGGDIEETALNTNLEAAEEVARQMRLRDLGGLVVIDFIDMSSGKHQRMVEDRLQQALKLDRARVQIGKISRFGLLELSRQRLRPSLGESSQVVCPRCDGHGRMRSVESLSLSILRLSEEQAMKDKTAQVLVQAPPQIANYLLNEKRRALVEIESRHEAPIIIVADESLETPHFNVTRIREGEQPEDTGKPSYQRGVPRKLEVHALTKAQLNVPAEPAVTHVKPAQIAPLRQNNVPEQQHVKQAPATKKAGLLSKIISIFTGDAEDAPKKSEPAPARRNDNNRRDRSDNRSNPRNPQNKQQRGNRPERSEEERKVADDQRKQRREEQQKRESERKEAQRAENQRREAEKRAQREAEATTRASSGLNAQTEEAAVASAEALPVVVDAVDNASSTELQTDGSPRRRRGRRGGRRRRRQEGETAGVVDAANDQSEMDFEETDDVLSDAGSPERSAADAPAASDTDTESRKQSKNIQHSAPVIVSAIPVSTAESDFIDLGTASETQHTATTQAPAPVESDITSNVIESFVPETTPAPEPIVAAAPVIEPTIQPVPPPAQVAFSEPKPKQMGYVPAAPPSFSMPNTPNPGFDFTVRISPENKED